MTMTAKKVIMRMNNGILSITTNDSSLLVYHFKAIDIMYTMMPNIYIEYPKEVTQVLMHMVHYELMNSTHRN